MLQLALQSNRYNAVNVQHLHCAKKYTQVCIGAKQEKREYFALNKFVSFLWTCLVFLS